GHIQALGPGHLCGRAGGIDGRNLSLRIRAQQNRIFCALRRGHPERGPFDRHGHLDRKSTRLNSSHVSISYAVFCLKKKTLINNVRYLLKRKSSTLCVGVPLAAAATIFAWRLS